MLASSKSDKTKNTKEKLEPCNKGMLKEKNILKNKNEKLSHRVETSCMEKSLTTAMSSKKLKKRKKFKFFGF